VKVAVVADAGTIVPALAENVTGNGAPENIAVKSCMRVPVLTNETVLGDKAREDTTTEADALIAGVPLIAAVTVNVPEPAGAVYVAEFPIVVTVPPVAVNTGVNEVPAGLIVAVKLVCVPERRVAVVGEILMSATITEAVLVIDGLLAEVTVTVYVPTPGGAVNVAVPAGP